MNNNTIIENENEKQFSDLDFTVEQTVMHLPNGTPTRFFANVRTDTNEVLGVVSDRYEVLQNSDLLNPVEELFKTEGFGDFRRKTIGTHNGARVRAVYDFENYGIKLGNGEDLHLRLKVQNSFDGSLRASFQVGMVRLVCTNGLAVPVAAVGMTKKHTQALDTNLIRDAFARSVNAFKESVPVFDTMTKSNLTQEQGRNILLSFEKSKVMSERMRERIQGVWESPRFEKDRERTVWNLYNAVTQHLTHDVEGKRFELAERVNTGVLKALTNAVKKRDYVEALVGNLN